LYKAEIREALDGWKGFECVKLFPTTKSTYMGGSMQRKAFEQVNFAGGIPLYKAEIREALDGWKGFECVKA
jgi:hypothetical protein